MVQCVIDLEAIDETPSLILQSVLQMQLYFSTAISLRPQSHRIQFWQGDVALRVS